ncbi:ABC transporter substrate-binding protein [Leisingera methylohalidivorans]|uniref:Cobalamin ABC transporter substrate-binding protein n=1 Tax=Leisingera methylohalidivorans DSM 14336 TaxID=999552 RepID=V9VVN2_9RHOB|nr:ABC transporter substrate-binding protein [Leisingera methylohalidivorans]AHD02028.1 cobalamin ABC transporter substrate-binding protein [Leisingera methylohalidivorans DSM 14336]
MRRLPGIALALLWAATGAFAGPSRVVTMNLCADQLAMMLAAPGQLTSVSYIARDTRASAMAEAALAYPVNHGLAEEIYLLQPDLVIAGAYSTPATTDMLRRLGVSVVAFQPAQSLKDVRARILQMGEVLGREEAARALLADYDQRLAALQDAGPEAPRAALYAANGFTSGSMTLAGQILRAAGLRNIADEFGYEQSGHLPLELLTMSAPDLLIGTAPYHRSSRSEEVLQHPAVRRLAGRSGAGQIRDADWVCGTPHVLRAVAALAEERRKFLEKEGSQ